MILRLEFLIDPQPKQRARVRIPDPRRPEWATSRARRAMVWTPERTAAFEGAVRMEARSQLNRLALHKPLIPSPDPAFVAMTFYLRRPKSGPSAHLEYPTEGATVPDWDNLIKALLDGLNGVLWTDDKQVVSGLPTKLFVAKGERPRIEMLVANLESMAELVRSASESTIQRLSPQSGHGAV